eukprot:TRINITY_DN11281_c0_g1_i1.p1 TRINITY_DN11281_c0_g1~~TRINITY_DN11281_c0_g1_i1.p1  ORF type:complete len:511 (-),score=108.86 TRINITY_DN11281_c0_g1_i1:87-1619(-)
MATTAAAKIRTPKVATTVSDRSGEGSPSSPRSPSGRHRADKGEARVSPAGHRLPLELDTARSDDRKTEMQALIPAIAHTFGGIVGSAGLGLGLGMGKMAAAISGREVTDSLFFQSGGQVFLASNGIFPTVLFDHDGTLSASAPSDDHLRSAAVIVSNHVSYLDALVLPFCLGYPRVMAKSEIKDWPLFGSLGQELNVIWVDRNNSDSRAGAKRAIGDHCKAWQIGQRPLLIFPEGTTSNGVGLLDFKHGAFAEGMGVVPVIVKYTGSWDPSNPNFRKVDRTGKKKKKKKDKDSKKDSKKDLVPYDEKEWAMQFAGHLSHTCTVVVCQRYEPCAEERADPGLFAENVRTYMLGCLEDLHYIYEESETGESSIETLWHERRVKRREERSGIDDEGLSPGRAAASFIHGMGGSAADGEEASATDERRRLRHRVQETRDRKRRSSRLEEPAALGDAGTGPEDAEAREVEKTSSREPEEAEATQAPSGSSAPAQWQRTPWRRPSTAKASVPQDSR